MTRSTWNSLEVAKLVVSILTPFTVLWVGYSLTNAQRDADSRRMREKVAQELSAETFDRLHSIAQFAAALDSKSGALIPSLDVSEAHKRWHESVVEWGKYRAWNRARILRVLGGNKEFLDVFGKIHRTNYFAQLDGCVAEAYEAKEQDADPAEILQDCRFASGFQTAEDCVSALSFALMDVASHPKRAESASERVERGCGWAAAG